MPISVSVIIPTLNRCVLLEKAMSSVATLEHDAEDQIEVLIVDNGCTDQTSEVVASAQRGYPFLLRHLLETKQGLNHARNRAVAEAQGEWLIYLDDDMEVSRGWLRGLKHAIEGFAVDAATGPVDPRFEGGRPEFLSKAVLDSVCSTYSHKGDRLHLIAHHEAHQLPGCNFAVKKELARSVGGFHPGLDRSGSGMLAGGDFDLGMRIVAAGARVAYAPECRITHWISRAKISQAGLRKRWYGLGRTQRVLERLHQLEGRSPLRCAIELARAVCAWLLVTVKGDRDGRDQAAYRFWRQLGYLRPPEVVKMRTKSVNGEGTTNGK